MEPLPPSSPSAPMAGAWTTFGLASVVVFMVSLDATVVVAAFPALRHHFADATPATLSWTLNGYTILYAALLAAGGRLADSHGIRRCFLLGLALFTGASAACALAGTAAWLAGARLLQAVGAALVTPASLALVLAAFPSGQRQKVVNLWSAVGALAAAVGPVAGSAILEWASWPLVFLINVPVGVAAGVWGWRRLAEPYPGDSRRPAELGSVPWVMVGVGGIAFGLVELGEGGRSWSWSLGGLGVGIAALGALVFDARRRGVPGIEMRLFEVPEFRTASLASFAFGAAFSAGFLSFYLFIVGIWNYAQGRAGLAATPGPVLVLVVAAATSGLAARIGRGPLLTAGSLLYFAGNLWFCLRIRPEPDFVGTWLPGQLATGLGIGLLLPALTGAALATLNRGNLAIGNAVMTSVRLLGGSLGVAATVALVGSPQAGIGRFRILYGGLALTGLAVGGISRSLGRQNPGSASDGLPGLPEPSIP